MSYPPPPGSNRPPQPGYPPQQGGYPQQQPGYGQAQQPGYPPKQPGGGYGAPPPPPIPPGAGGGGFGDFVKDTGKGLLWKIVPAVLAVIVLGVIVIVRMVGGESAGDTLDALDRIEDSKISPTASEDDCMTQDWTTTTSSSDSSDPSEELVVECSADEAFWTITKVDTDIATEVDYAGEPEATDEFTELCGQEVMSYQFGQLWRDFYYVYTEGDYYIDYAFCLEAIDKPDASGRTPKTPDVGECFDDTDGYWTVDCSAANAYYIVDEIQVVDPPADMANADLTTELGGCSNSDYYAEAIHGYDGLTYGLLCKSVNV